MDADQELIVVDMCFADNHSPLPARTDYGAFSGLDQDREKTRIGMVRPSGLQFAEAYSGGRARDQLQMGGNQRAFRPRCLARIISWMWASWRGSGTARFTQGEKGD